MTLQQFFQEHPCVAIALSGGVDSAYLLYAAKENGANIRAYYAKSPFQPQFEHEDALRLARELHVPMTVLELDILSDPAIASNPQNRCYYCKRRIFSTIAEAAAKDGFSLILDGTNASDDAADRPGMQALRELRVLSPLRECGLTKEKIRQLSKDAGLFTHDKPAYACLATRIPTGTPITQELLSRTERSEDLLRNLGFSDFRIRLMGDAAKIQLPESQIPILLLHREAILATFKRDYSAVLLDLEVRNG